MAEAQARIARSLRLDRVACSRRDHRYLLAPLEIDKVGIDDELEHLDHRVDLMTEPTTGRVRAEAKESDIFELQPVDYDSTAHESVLVDDAVTSAMIRHLSAADPDALAEAAAAAIAGRYHELRER